ncbi:uncharacterized protein BJ171DRAFT_39183 [Polychytrium aggregatum]|uniref:uncharacterized protein n=1 Tax=Polychytrium aggregatum TaxID=110093 RepID=UPI0022FDD3BD|nr:uncharacterized protein BJ171DRAFT_39183 [Polychytrium aggregatum]KAI9205999.1 hypothetical protein BJ171DRAFT_39183 [Polychytrium aggregatum]
MTPAMIFGVQRSQLRTLTRLRARKTGLGAAGPRLTLLTASVSMASPLSETDMSALTILASSSAFLASAAFCSGETKADRSAWDTGRATHKHCDHEATCTNSGSSSRTSWSCGCSDPHSPLRGSGGDGSTRQSPPCRTWSTAECNPTCRWHRGIDGCSQAWYNARCI